MLSAFTKEVIIIQWMLSHPCPNTLFAEQVDIECAYYDIVTGCALLLFTTTCGLSFAARFRLVINLPCLLISCASET